MFFSDRVSDPRGLSVRRRTTSLPPVLKGGLAGLLSLLALASCSAPGTQHPSEVAAKSTELHVAAEPSIEGEGQKRLRLLSQQQYVNTITDLFGADVVPTLAFAPFQRTEGLIATGAAYEGITETQLEQYQRGAATIAEWVVSPERREFLFPCSPADIKAPDDACAAKFLSYVGQRLFRRPLTPDKLTDIVAEARAGAERLQDFYGGIRLVLEGLLFSPRTLSITEVWERDPENPGLMRLDSYSLASRLSFFLWNRAPDDALLKAAANGELYNPKGRGRIVDAMLASPKLEAGVRAFFDDMFGFDKFETLAKDPLVYPIFTGTAVEDAREQTLRFLVHHLVSRNGDYRDIFTARDTFISPALATLYREPSTTTWSAYTAPDNSRSGLLTQIAFLALHSHPGRSSPTVRGKAIRELLLCQPVPSPPANVDFSALENPPPNLRTTRERVDFHLENPVCAGCHRITDPIGLALENFDGAGQYRETEKGVVIDASGTLDGKPFTDAAGLGRALHDSAAVPACLVKRIYAYAVGGRVARSDQPLVDYFKDRFVADGYRVPSLMRTIALSKAFSQSDENQGQPDSSASDTTRTVADGKGS